MKRSKSDAKITQKITNIKKKQGNDFTEVSVEINRPTITYRMSTIVGYFNKHLRNQADYEENPRKELRFSTLQRQISKMSRSSSKFISVSSFKKADKKSPTSLLKRPKSVFRTGGFRITKDEIK